MTDLAGDMRFLQAAALLPHRLRKPLERLGEEDQHRAEEIRLRCGRPASLVFPEGECPFPGGGDLVTAGDLSLVLEIATQASAHTALSQVKNGFFTVRDGHRIGICGSAVVKNGGIYNLRQISSLAIRIAREAIGAAAPVADKLLEHGRLRSTLILSPPGWGKTTLLRDLIRMISDGDGMSPMRVGVADERGELAAVWEGKPQLNVGALTDVMDGCPKAAGLLMLLRGMNPQVLCADEITAPEDAAALEMAANCGVVLLATAHAEGKEDLYSRPLYRRLLEGNTFQRLVSIERTPTGRAFRVEKLGEKAC